MHQSRELQGSVMHLRENLLIKWELVSHGGKSHKDWLWCSVRHHWGTGTKPRHIAIVVTDVPGDLNLWSLNIQMAGIW